ncbi:hypothetical protein ES703_94471 [subsurface metagenome]
MNEYIFESFNLKTDSLGFHLKGVANFKLFQDVILKMHQHVASKLPDDNALVPLSLAS